MRVKVYFFRLFVGLTAFFIGIAVFVVSGISRMENDAKPVLECETQLNSVADIPPDFVRLIQEETEFNVQQKYETVPEGEFYVFNDVPKEFKDFETLQITASEYKENSNQEVVLSPTIPTGSIYAKRKYELKEIHINFRQIAFKTTIVNGISYRFSGEFTEKDSEDWQKDEPIYLKGRLDKLKNGKQIAKTQVSFAASGC